MDTTGRRFAAPMILDLLACAWPRKPSVRVSGVAPPFPVSASQSGFKSRMPSLPLNTEFHIVPTIGQINGGRREHKKVVTLGQASKNVPASVNSKLLILPPLKSHSECRRPT